MNKRSLPRRALAFLLCLVMLISLLPANAFVFAAPANAAQKTTEDATVEVVYDGVNRSKAEVRYHKEGIEADPVNIVFLVDRSRLGQESMAAFNRMISDHGANYLFDYGVASNVRVITYENKVMGDQTVGSKEGLLNALTTSGEGYANEVPALQRATEAVQEFNNGNPTVVYWVLGDRFGQSDETQIEAELEKLTDALGDDDALITWQLADQPSPLLEEYATKHGEAHDEDAQITAAHAAADAVVFRSEMAADVEEIAHDHYHAIKFTLPLAKGQTVVEKITDARYNSGSAYTDIDIALAEDGQSVSVTLNRVCRQSDIDFVLDLQLKNDVFQKETVFKADSITAPEDHSNGGLHTGIFDQNTVFGLTLNMPAAEIDRQQYSVSFTQGSASGTLPETIHALPGQQVIIPDGEGLSGNGSFGGWNGNDGRHYSAGEILNMPEKNLELTPAFGYVDVELEVGNVNEAAPVTNNLSDQAKSWDLLSFIGVTTEDGSTIGNTSIQGVYVIDQNVSYEKVEDEKDANRVKVEGAAYARHVGATEGDHVVAYLTKANDNSGKYDLYIAGPGGVKAPEDMGSWMSGSNSAYGSWAREVKTIDLSALDTSETTRMNYMFNVCRKLTSLNLGNHFDTSNVTLMNSMFSECNALTSLNLGDHFDTAKVKNMNNMFSGCNRLTSLELGDRFDTSSVSDMGSMFYGCGALTTLDVSEFKTANVTIMANMFGQCTSLINLDVSNFDTGKVENMNSMFNGCWKLPQLTFGDKFTTESVTNGMASMFEDCKALTELDLSGFNTSKVKSMSGMFKECNNLTKLTLGENFDTSSVTDMSEMFYVCSKLQALDLGEKFDTSNVRNMNQMFRTCASLTELDLGDRFNTSNVESAREMFAYCSGLTKLTLGDGFTMGKATTLEGMFRGCGKLTALDLGDQFLPEGSVVETMESMFSDCVSLKSLDLGENFHTASVKDMHGMFYKCTDLETLDLGDHFDTSQVTEMGLMFGECQSLQSLDLGEQFDISSVTDLGQVFDGDEKLATITGGLRLGKENAMTYMNSTFADCKALTTTPFVLPEGGTADFPNLSYMYDVFEDCTALETVDLSGWNLGNLTSTLRMFRGCSGLEKVNLSWSGIRSDADGFRLDDMFNGVPNTAVLEIGTDTSENTAAVMEKIAAAFPGKVTKGDTSIADTPAEDTPNTDENTPTETPGADENVPSEETPGTDEGASEETPGTDEGTSEDTPDVDEGASEETPGADAGASEETPDTDEGASEETPGADEGASEETPGTDEGASEETPDADEDTSASSGDESAGESTPADENTDVAPSTRSLAEAMNTGSAHAAERSAVMTLLSKAGANESIELKVHPEATPAGSDVQYRVRVKYVGDKGAQSGRIHVSFPMPENVRVLTQDELNQLNNEQGTSYKLIEISDVEYSDGAASGFKGGRVVTAPKVENNALTATVEGLYTGNEYEISIWCRTETTDVNDEGYMIWDGVASAVDSAASAVSNIYRLWYKDGDATKPEESDQYTLTYAFKGDVPPDAQAPAASLHKKGETVTAAQEPTTKYDYYTFKGWTKPDGSTVNPGGTLNMPDSNLTLTGTWTLDESNAPKVTVTYAYTSENEAHHVPDGAPEITATQDITVGDNHAVVRVNEHVDHHIFGGWTPTLKINGTDVPLSENNGVYSGEYGGTTYTIDLATGILQTEQFRDVAGSNAVTIAFTGPWRPYMGTIHFDGNGAQGTVASLTDVAYDTKTAVLPSGGGFTYPQNGYQFMGWATAPSGAVAYKEGDSAAGIITSNGAEVTLYAVWSHTEFGVGYNFDKNHVTSTNTDTTVNLNDSYSTTLSAINGHTIKAVTITMGGVDITDDVYNAGAVNIDKVTGDILITVTTDAPQDTTAPVVTPGQGDRLSASEGTAGFTSNEDGTYHYVVVEEGAAQPSAEDILKGESDSCTADKETTIDLDNLSGNGAKDVWIIVTDANGNQSDPVKVTVPAYEVSITADDTNLDFGEVIGDDYTPPEAQEVVIKNDGSGDMVVTLPDDDDLDYTVDFGEGVTPDKNGNVTLKPGEDVTIVVQPKPGLSVGDHDGTITIPAHDANDPTNTAEVEINVDFTVKDENLQITTDPSALDFGTVKEGYTPPAGQTVTITNTGNVEVTLPLPTMDGYTVTGGEGFENGSAVLAPGASVTITVQPEDGLAKGNHDAVLELIGTAEGGATVTAKVAVSFTVTASSGGGGTVTPDDDLTITIKPSEGGSTDPEGEVSVEPGDDITITITPDEGYEIGDVIIDGESVGPKDEITFEDVDSDHTVEIIFKPVEDTDLADPDDTGVSDNLNTEDHILFLNGYPDGSFGPNRSMTRAEVAGMFSNLLLDKDVDITTAFSDVADDAWYADAVNTLASLSIIAGYEDGTFRPDQPITRAEFTAIASRFANTMPGGENRFSDVHEGDWFYDVVVGASQYGWIGGYEDGTFRPQNTITRAEVTSITNRMLGRVPDEAFIAANADVLRLFSDVTTRHWAYYSIVEATNAHDYTKQDGNEDWTALHAQ